MNKSRRTFIFGTAGLFVSTAASAALTTPRQTAGPFYPPELPLDNDNDLVHVQGQSEAAGGLITDLRGRLLDRNGEPLRGMRMEIWQCDANGRYRHPRDPGDAPIDPGFQGFGHTLSDAQGRYRFLTIRPVPYPGRTPHIHVAVYPPGEAPFVTQLYVAGESRNAEDFLYNRIPADLRPLVTTEFAPSAHEDADLSADWDVVLGVV